MNDAQSTGSEAARARLRGKRIALGVVIAVAVVFIGASAVQIVPDVFGAGIEPLPSAPAGSSARLCAEGVRTLLDALAAPPAGSAATPGRSSTEPSPEDWERVARDCEKASGGEDAWAALVRLRSAREQLAFHGIGLSPQERAAARETIDLDPLRRDVAAHLPADLR